MPSEHHSGIMYFIGFLCFGFYLGIKAVGVESLKIKYRLSSLFGTAHQAHPWPPFFKFSETLAGVYIVPNFGI